MNQSSSRYQDATSLNEHLFAPHPQDSKSDNANIFATTHNHSILFNNKMEADNSTKSLQS